MRFIFIKHAEDDGEYRGGWSNRNINEHGMLQAKKLAQFLNKNKAKLNIQKFVISDLMRSIATAQIANQYINVQVEHESRLREINNGDLAGMLNSDAIKKYPGVYFNTLDMDENYPNGESPLEFFCRVKNWFYEAVNYYKSHPQNGNIALITHSGVINIIYYLIKGLNWTNKTKSFKIDNCSLHILDLETMSFDIENYTNFLN